MQTNDTLVIGGHEFHSRFILGSGKYSLKLIETAVKDAGAEIITLAVRRANTKEQESILDYIPKNVTLLPNTSGARNAEEAVRIARLARELGCGDFVKIEIMRDSKYLLPDNTETIKATEILAKEGFVVMPYMYPDLNVARDLVSAGAAAVMPLASPIGSNKGLATREFIQILIDEIDLPIIVDAGIGRPSQACEAMEMGAAAIMTNTALATAGDLPLMAAAFRQAIEAGRKAYAIEDSRIMFHVFSMKATQFCPYCGMASTKVHSTYIRNIEDIPIQERQTILRVKTRKMFCNNPECQHKTYSESFEFVEPKGRKTKRLLTRILKTSLSLSSINASSILKEEHVLVGKSTICKLIKKNANFDAE